MAIFVSNTWILGSSLILMAIYIFLGFAFGDDEDRSQSVKLINSVHYYFTKANGGIQKAIDTGQKEITA